MNTLRDFTHRILPWVVAAIALLIFLVTLNGWLTLPTIPFVARLSGWDWQLLYTHPVHYLLTLPLRLLPANMEVMGLNLFSALCGALTIALLARSVSLLPHDRTREQRQRETDELALLSIPLSWIPPLFAGLALALQLTFWENATAPGSEMLDLLLFAYCIRALLEYRVTKNETWLAKLALVYGIGITNNWAMIGFFPLFLIALVWIKGLAFFKLRFILRMVAFGLVGLAFYFVLPIVHTLSSQTDVGFFKALRENWGYQKTFIFILPFISAPTLRAHLFMLSLTSIIPLLLIGIRWSSFRGETSAAAGIITTLMFKVMHIALLAICVWVFFDPKFSGRLLGFGLLPFLTFYFLTALSVGYLLGYVLLVFGKEPDRRWEKTSSTWRVVNRAIAGLALLLAIAVPIGLVAKNWDSIRTTNGSLLPDYANRLNQNLPGQKAIVLSDDPSQLMLLHATYQKAGKTDSHVLLSTLEMGNPEYRAQLKRRHPELAATLDKAAGVTLSDVDKLMLLDLLSQQFPIYYLHPSFGYFFERFYSVPRGLNYELRPFEGGALLPPALDAAVVSENEKFWATVKSEIQPRFPKAGEVSNQAKWIGASYSRALNNWGVQMQRRNSLGEAKEHFGAAVEFNPDNIVAQINSQFNEQLRAGKVEAVAATEEIEKKLNQFGSLTAAMNVNGPFDELNANLGVGQVFAMGNNFRQAIRYFSRVLELVPNDPRGQIAMIMTYFDMMQPDKALAQIKELRNNRAIQLTEGQRLQVLRIESLSYLAQKQISTAEEIMMNARREFPRNEGVNALLREFYLQAAVIHINDKQYQSALDYLNALLKMAPNDPHGLFNRALAYLQMGRLNDAKSDYQQLEKSLTERSHRVHYGLAEVAMRQNDTREATRQYQIYLEIAPKDTPEYKEVEERVRELQGAQAR